MRVEEMEEMVGGKGNPPKYTNKQQIINNSKGGEGGKHEVTSATIALRCGQTP